MRHLCLLLLGSILLCSRLAGGETLRNAAGNRLLVGCAVATVDLGNPKVAAFVAEQFNCITPEYDLMPGHLVDDDGKFTFEAGDRVLAFAEAHHMPVFGHMLVWHFVTRKWLFEDQAGKPLPRAKALANLKKYIDAVAGHYKGRIRAWDVVNEALSDNDGEYLRDTPALRAIGADYIEQAFAFAHAADPQAQLYYNDYNIEQPAKLKRTIRLIRSLQAKGVPIDAVGIQGHWLIDWPPPDMIGKGIDALAAAGVKVMITELDVDPLPRNGSGANMAVVEKGVDPYRHGLPPEMQEKLAKRYGEIVGEITRHPAVTMIGFWGTHDGRSWLNDYPVKGRTNHPLLFDREYKPKPAFDAVLKAFETVRITFVGDLMFDRQPGAVIARGGDPFQKVAAILAAADIVVGNLECVVAADGQRADKHFTFRAHPRCLPLLAKHLDAVSLANNHTGDFGTPALVEMLGRIEGAGLHAFGAGRDEAAAHSPLVLRRKGLRIALLAYNAIDSPEAAAGPSTPGLAWLDERRAVADIRAAHAKADVVIAFLHWGVQFDPRPTEDQRRLARALIDAGAAAVVGSHPHVTQGAETYKGCPIIYSLGDFIFDFEDPTKTVPEALTNWMLRLTLDKKGVVAWDTIVSRTDRDGVPQPVAGVSGPKR